MKSVIKAVALAAIVAAPVVSFAQQSNQPLTRAQVRAELVQLEQAGYRPEVNDRYYPQDIQAAEARVAEQRGQATGYGPAVGGASQSGDRSSGAASSYSPPVVTHGE
jgi:hypothetical protein